MDDRQLNNQSSSRSTISSASVAPTLTSGHSEATLALTRLRVENQSLKTDNIELMKKYKIKTEELDPRIPNLKQVVDKLTLENQELRQKHSVLQKVLDLHKLERNNDIQIICNDMDVERPQKKVFETKLRALEHDINDRTDRLVASRKQLMATLAENQALKQKEDSLLVDKHQLSQNLDKLADDCRKYKESADQLTDRCTELDAKIAKLELLVTKQKNCLADKLAKEKSKLNSSFNTKTMAFKRKILSLKKISNLNQKKLFETKVRALEQQKNRWAKRLIASRKKLLQTLAENQAIKQRKNALIVERHLLRQNSAKLVADCRKYKESADQMTDRCTESDAKIAKLEVLVTKQKNGLAEKLAKEKSKLKSGFNKQITALKRQNSYLKKSSDLSKKNHLVTEYRFQKHENIYKRNVKQIHDSVDTNTEQTFKDLREELIDLVESKRKRLTTSNTKGMADVIRENKKNSETINTNADKINESIEDGFVQCPECDRKFTGMRTLRVHLKARHFIDDEIDNKIIDSIDLVDD